MIGRKKYMLKKCLRCKNIKTSEQFDEYELNEDGKFNWCIECVDEYKDILNTKQKSNLEENGMKICSRCGENLNISKFNKSKETIDGFKSMCKQCGNETVREFNNKLKDLIDKYYNEKIPYGYRKCFVCKEIKLLTEFGVCSKSPDGINTRCKCCKRQDKKLRKNKQTTRRIPTSMTYCVDCKEYVDKVDIEHSKYGNVCKKCHMKRKDFIKKISRCIVNGINVDEYLLDVDDIFSIDFNTIDKEYEENNKIRGIICRWNRYSKIKHIVEFQTCNKCGITKHILNYRTNKYRNTGFEKICKTCDAKKRKGKKRDRTNEYKKESERIKTDPEYRIRKSIKGAIRSAFRQIGKKKEFPTAAYGIDFAAIFSHIGSRPSEEYQLDHIIPVVMFDFTNPEHVKLAHVPENLRWLLASANSSKQDKIIWDIIFSNDVLLEIAKKLNLNESHDGHEASQIKAMLKGNK